MRWTGRESGTANRLRRWIGLRRILRDFRGAAGFVILPDFRTFWVGCLMGLEPMTSGSTDRRSAD